ncbi:MAG: FAD-binding protein, partial [Acidimicrobiia bacterium]
MGGEPNRPRPSVRAHDALTGAVRRARAGAVSRDRTTLETDVLVIGSGAGGAVTAATLARAGRDVTVVEEGPWVDPAAMEPFSL